MSLNSSHVVVSLSGGLDSTVCLHWAQKNYEKVSALFFDYGQKALDNERKASLGFCKKLQISFKEISLSFLSDYSSSALNSEQQLIPTDEVDIESAEKSKDSAAKVWVPNRNGLFISVCASYAEALGASRVILGFNKEEAETFPDNSKEYLDKINEALLFSTKNQVQVESPTLQLDKKEIYSLGSSLDVDFSQVWPCYFSGEKPCGVCESCRRFERAKN